MTARLAACAAMKRDAERRACYDRAVAALGADGLKQFGGGVTAARRGDDGMIVLTLDNSQVWHKMATEEEWVAITDP